MTQTKAGFVAILGLPNAGKSTLLNTIIGQKVTIVSPKVQTTRTRLLGIHSIDETQMIFIDTPGLFKGKTTLEKAIVDAAWQSLDQCDKVLFLVDAKAAKKPNYLSEVKSVFEALKKRGMKLFCALNKIDLISKNDLLALTSELYDESLMDELFMISAANKEGVDRLLSVIADTLPLSPFLYDPDQITDMPEKLFAAEVTREKLFLNLQQELPYQLTVETENWERFDNGSLKINQTVYVSKQNYKKIILGKNGQTLKKIGSDARLELEDVFECKVHLFLFVKVREKWQKDPERYELWGLSIKP